MGEAAGRHYLRNTTPSERLDVGIRLWLHALEVEAAKVPVPPGATAEERAQLQFVALRRRFG